MKEIKITIEGKAMTGKTTVGAIVFNALRDAGFNVKAVGDALNEHHKSFERRRVNPELAAQVSIDIHEHQLPRK